MLCSDSQFFRLVAIREPRLVNSDHYMVMGELLIESPESYRWYTRPRSRMPLKLPIGPLSMADTLFQPVKAQHSPPPPKREWEMNDWISDRSWALMDAYTAARRGNAARVIVKVFKRHLRSSLKEDRRQRPLRPAWRWKRC